jgi:hypothetical protein
MARVLRCFRAKCSPSPGVLILQEAFVFLRRLMQLGWDYLIGIEGRNGWRLFLRCSPVVESLNPEIMLRCSCGDGGILLRSSGGFASLVVRSHPSSCPSDLFKLKIHPMVLGLSTFLHLLFYFAIDDLGSLHARTVLTQYTLAVAHTSCEGISSLCHTLHPLPLQIQTHFTVSMGSYDTTSLFPFQAISTHPSRFPGNAPLRLAATT